MATTPSKKQRDTDNDEATAIAWNNGPRNPQVQKARRVKVWLKKSVTNLTSPRDVEFENSPPSSKRRSFVQRRDPARNSISSSSQRRHQQSSSSRRASSTTTSSKTTATIDQAMFSLYTYTGPKKKLLGTSVVTVEPETPSSYVPNYDYDWMLDGREEWKQAEQTSVEYLQYLDEPWDMETYINNYLQGREEKLQHELEEEEGAFQFEAKFDDEPTSSAVESISKGKEPQLNRGEDDLKGKLQKPTTEPLDDKEATEEEDDDFGEFQAAENEDNSTAPDVQVESEINNRLQTPRTTKITTENTLRQEDHGQEQPCDDAPIPELSDEKDSDDVSSLGCNDSGSVDLEDSDNEDPHEDFEKETNENNIEEEHRNYKETNNGEHFEAKEEQIPAPVPCNGLRNVPSYSPGSIGDSIFACSYRDEELESTEEEIVAEAVGILESCRSTAEDTPKPKSSNANVREGQTKEDQLREDKRENQRGGVETATTLSQTGSSNNKQVGSNGQSVADDAVALGDAEDTGTCEGGVPHSDLLALSPKASNVGDKISDENSQDASLEHRFADDSPKSEMKKSTDLDDEEESFGDFCEATPVSNLDLSVEPADTLPENKMSQNDEISGNFDSTSTTPKEAQGLYPLDISSIEYRRDATRVTIASPSSLENETQEPNAQVFTPTFAVLPPIKVDPTVHTQQEAANDRSFDEPAHTTAEQESDIFSVGSNISHPHDIPVSLRLRITDLSTPEARFARRQWQKYNRAIRTTQENEKQLESTSSLGELEHDILTSLDEDEPLSAIADLEIPQYYFTQPDLDDTVRVLQNAPWHHVAHLWHESEGESDGFGGLKIASAYSFDDQHDRRALWEEYLTEELCRLDTAQNQLSKHVLRRIKPHAPTLNVANRSIHEFATNLQLAHMYLERSQAAVRQAARGTCDHKQQQFNCFDGWNGANELLEAWDQQELYRRFQATLNQIQDILDSEKLLQKQTEDFTFNKTKPNEYSSLIYQVEQLRTSVLSNDALTRLDALADLRTRLHQRSLLLDFFSRLHTLAESVAVRCCRRRQMIQLQEYRTLLGAAFLVRETTNPFQALQTSGGELSQSEIHEERPSPTSLVPSDLTSTWPQTVMQALCYEANRALAAALLDPLLLARDGDTTTDSEYERELTGLAYDMQQDWGDTAKLRTICHNLIIIRFDWESANRYLLPVYHRLCLILVDVLYAHHTFAQWHGEVLKEYRRRTQNNEEDGKEEKCEAMDGQQYQDHHSKLPESNPSKCFPLLEEIQASWLKSREDLWECCEGVLIKCLEEYLHFASHRSLFQHPLPRHDSSSGSLDESEHSHGTARRNSPEFSPWRRDLEDLHSVLVLTEQFVSIKDQFFEEEHENKAQLDGALRERLCDVFRKHLRHVHVEAMKSLGMSLSQETWDMISLKDISDFETSDSISLQALMAGALSEVSETIGEEVPKHKRGAGSALSLSRGDSKKYSRRSLFRQQRENTVSNPFLTPPPSAVSDEQFESNGEVNKCGQHKLADTGSSREVYELISEVLSGSDTASPFARVASKSTVKVFFSWVGRLLLVMERLPLIVEDISAVFANLCDLYFTTVFRLCAGNAANERLVLGVDSPAQPAIDSNTFAPMSPEKPKPPSSPPLFGFRRKSSSGSIGGGRRRSSAPRVEIPTTLEADICAPLKSEMLGVSHTRDFVRRAQNSLKDIVILDKVDNWFIDPVIVGANPDDNDKIVVQAIQNLEKRLGAAWSCLSIAAMLDATCDVARKKLSSSAFGRRFVGDLASFEHYTEAVFKMVPQLVRLSSRISCVRAILAKRVVLEILKVGCGWEEAKLNEHPNEYVDALCGRCACIWAALQVSKKGLPNGAIKITWEDMIRGGFVTLMEGFSKVPFCSTEGRALMSMDLASFSAGTSPSSVLERLEYGVQYEAPPKIDPQQGMRYLDTYIKVFYYPREDVMGWIRENFRDYKLSHSLTLAANAFRTPDGTDDDGNGIPVEVALEAVRNIYQDGTSFEEADGDADGS